MFASGVSNDCRLVVGELPKELVATLTLRASAIERPVFQPPPGLEVPDGMAAKVRAAQSASNYEPAPAPQAELTSSLGRIETSSAKGNARPSTKTKSGSNGAPVPSAEEYARMSTDGTDWQQQRWTNVRCWNARLTKVLQQSSGQPTRTA